ncbi:LTA synthase family protein [Carboxylicivirga mesophila]|uniref:LTA synthase family protein n=1 Tax=Carboxylicivirga mesophila TaxID=1166478 RepID=UPI001FD4B36D|nr:alkaline phosphatase family protein [Carboxylicivirga mesophila]
MIKQYIYKVLRLFAFWMVLFTVLRSLFVLFNLSYAHEATIGSILQAFVVGLRLDSSFTGYLVGLAVVSQILALLFTGRFWLRVIDYISYLLIAVVSIFLLSDINLFSYWGRHIDLEAIGFLKTPDIVMASLKWYETVLFLLVCIIVIAGFIVVYQRLVKGDNKQKNNRPFQIKYFAVSLLIVLFTGALLILPIRGSLGVAPINTGVAYFSSHRFANQTAINPLWNLAYSMKRMDATKITYHYMPDEEADAIFKQMMEESGQFPRLLKSDRPNVVVILLESFAAHVIEALDGQPVAPHFNELVSQGVLFTDIYAAANRSDKGLVAAMAGYQVLPSYSIIRFPEKTNSLPYLPDKLKQAGYQELSYLYGGDIKFKNMNSFVKQAGFEEVISIDEFPDEFQGKKWGVHDEYVFDRLLDEMLSSQEPYFKFFFTLSSHEPFIVPMERKYKNDYHNSIAYTDQCLGEFMNEVKQRGLWDNTLFVLIADHGVPGPEKLSMEQQDFFHIPMLWTGGALAVSDTTVNKIGSQTDMAKTLLSQLNIQADDMRFSKNILDETSQSFAFFVMPSNGMGLVEEGKYQAFSNNLKKFIVMEGKQTALDSLKAKAYLQVLYNDSKNR